MMEQQITRRRLLKTAGVVAGGMMVPGLLAACGRAAGSASTSPTAVASGASAVPSASAAESLESLARAEGSLVFYNPGPDFNNALIAGFTKAYPWAKVETFTGNPAAIVNKLVTEVTTNVPTADVIQLPGSQRETLMASNALAPAEIPNEAKMPPGFSDPTGYAHPLYVSLICVYFNTNLLTADKVPTDIFEYADPAWKGTMAFDKPQNRVQSATWLAAPRKKWGDEKWRAWLDGLKANDIFITNDATSAYQNVVRGERQTCIDGITDFLTQDPGTPASIGWYDDMASFVQYNWVTSKAAHPNMAKLFLDYMISEPGQLIVAEQGRSPILDVDSPVSLSQITPPGTTFLDQADLSDFFENTSEYIEIYDSLWPA